VKIVDSIARLKTILNAERKKSQKIGFVPTMGALHDGHLSLIALAKQTADFVVASVFVNPTQFGPNEDLDAYPRDLDADSHKLKAEGCDLLFAPTTTSMYPPGFETDVRLSVTTQGLCGAHRPGHFDGVTTVVLKLFGIVGPDVAVFGRKDYQQLTVIRRMVEDLCLDIEIIGAPLIRETDGLAMSSRNVYLSKEDRTRALALSRALFSVRENYQSGERQSEVLLAQARDIFKQHNVSPEYLEIRRADNLQTIESIEDIAVMLVAAKVGSTRLIDNIQLGE
jgi:pantoate--beta-alanine ligase